MNRPRQPAAVAIVPVKPSRKSRMIWFNVLAVLPLLVEAVAVNAGLIQPLVPAGAYPWVLAILAIGNVWLRVITRAVLGDTAHDAHHAHHVHDVVHDAAQGQDGAA